MDDSIQPNSNDSVMEPLDDISQFANIDGLDGVDSIDDIDAMDHLFLDPGPVPPSPPAKGILERLSEMQTTGCCQKLCWSRLGCIAFITRDGLTVKIQAYAPTLDSDSVTLNTASVHGSEEILHVSWDHTGSNLAVIDGFGRLSIFKTIVCLNKITIIGRYVPEEADPYNMVVGMEWTVPQGKEGRICHSASRKNEAWSYAEFTEPVRGVHHPIAGSHVVFLVTRSGALRMVYTIIYPEPENSYAEVNSPLTENFSFDSLITHASFAGHQDETMLLITYNVSNALHLYRVSVDWNYPFPPNQRPPASFKLVPTLKVTHLQIVQSFTPVNLLKQGQTAKLVHLNLFPALEDSVSNQQFPVEIVASFASNDLETHVSRWEVQESTEQLQSCFQQLSSKKTQKNITSQLNTTLGVTHKDELVIPYIVVSVLPLRFDTCAVFCRADGVTEFRERQSSLSLLESHVPAENVYYLQNAGFAFPQQGQCTVATLSPSGCVLLVRDADGEGQESHNEYSLRYMDHQSEDDSMIIPALTIPLATACLRTQQSDDLLETIRRIHKRQPVNIDSLLNDIYIATNLRKVSIATDMRQLMSNYSLFRCFSVQLVMGSRPFVDSNQPSNVAWMLTSFRICLVAVLTAWDNAKRENYSSAGLPLSLFGLFEWYINTVVYIVGDMFHLAENLQAADATSKKEMISARFPIHMVMNGVCRMFLRWINRYIRSVDDIYNQIKDTHAPSCVRNWGALRDLVANSPVDIFRFDTMLAELDHYVKDAYEKNGTSEDDRIAAEWALMLATPIPAVLEPVTERLVSSTLNKLLETVQDASRVFFGDFAIVWAGKRGVGYVPGRPPGACAADGTVNGHAEGSPGEVKIDAIRRVPLVDDQPLRRCIRCECYMENMDPKAIGMSWIMALQRQCLCGCPWVIVNP